MHSTKDLLAKALTIKPAKFWSDRYFISQSTLSEAKKKGRLSPIVAGNLAMDIGEEPGYWIAVAATETERKNPMVERIQAVLARSNP